MNPLLFIHIPKTAGSSLLKTAMDQFGGDAVERDYGPKGEYSSELVKRFIYDVSPIDEFAFYSEFSEQKKRFLGGHFFSDRYLQLFGAQNTISFVRNPIDRVISEYTYLQHKHGLGRPFEEFYRSDAETNKQFRMIGQAPWKAFNLVGTLEHYSDCIDLLAREQGVALTENKENRNPNRQGVEVSNAMREDIRKWNERDILFYEDVKQYLSKRLSADNQNKPFCYHDMGLVPGEHIIGWAFYAQNNKPVTLTLHLDGRQVAETIASEHRAELQQLQTPRAGHNGFRFVLGDYKSADQIELKAPETHQTLLKWTRP